MKFITDKENKEKLEENKEKYLNFIEIKHTKEYTQRLWDRNKLLN